MHALRDQFSTIRRAIRAKTFKWIKSLLLFGVQKFLTFSRSTPITSDSTNSLTQFSAVPLRSSLECGATRTCLSWDNFWRAFTVNCAWNYRQEMQIAVVSRHFPSSAPLGFISNSAWFRPLLVVVSIAVKFNKPNRILSMQINELGEKSSPKPMEKETKLWHRKRIEVQRDGDTSISLTHIPSRLCQKVFKSRNWFFFFCYQKSCLFTTCALWPTKAFHHLNFNH